MTPSHASYGDNPAQNKAVGDFVSNLCFGRPGVMDSYCSMGVVHGGKLVAGTLFHNWHPECGVIEMTSASVDRRWLSRSVIQSMFTMAFNTIGAQLVTLRVSENNADMIAIAKRFGFDGVLIPRLRGRNEAEWIFTLTDDAWLNSRFCRTDNKAEEHG